MPISPYLRDLRAAIGHRLLLLPTVTAIVADGDGVLLLHPVEGDRWMLPGGYIDPGETPADACAREVWEETGLEVEPTKLLGVFGGGPDFSWTYRNGDEVSFVMTLFGCDVTGGTLRPDGLEAREARYVGPDEATALPLTPTARRALDAVWSGRSGPWFEPRTWRP